MTPDQERAEERAAFQLLRTQRDELERENTTLRACLGPSLRDCDRLDKLEKQFPRLAAQISGNAISTPTLRDAIDGA